MAEGDPIKEISVSVRRLAEYFCMGGDIVGGFGAAKRMEEGRLVHLKRQAEAMEDAVLCEKEVPLSCCVEKNGLRLRISGRADIILQTDEGYIIEEIKSGAAVDEKWEPAAVHFCPGALLCLHASGRKKAWPRGHPALLCQSQQCLCEAFPEFLRCR